MKGCTMRTWIGLLTVAAGVGLTGLNSGTAEEKKDDKAKEPKYPHVNLAVTYEVDPKWPQRPDKYAWGHVPGIAVDAKDNVYVFTRAQPPVQVYDTKGKFLRGWGDKSISAHHIKIDPDGVHVWISDIANHVVEKYTPDGKCLLTIGTKGKKGRDKTHLNMPTDMAITPSGEVYVSDGYGNARVVHFDKNGKYLNEWGELGHKPGMFSIPHAIAIDAKGRIYVADRNNVRVQVFDGKGKFLTEWKNLIVPWGLCVTKDDEIWVCGSSPMQWRKEDGALGCPPKDQIFMKFNTDGKLLQLFTVPKGVDGLERVGEVNWVHCIAVDSGGNLYLGDIIGKRAQKFVMKNP
jgi:DNA-binding beta-propeller fold protein YncE